MIARSFSVATALLLLAGCAIKSPPTGGAIMPESARGRIVPDWSASHTRGEVVPGWIRSFNDSELTALVADAVERNPDLKAAAAKVEASRAAVRVAASSLYPRMSFKALGSKLGADYNGDLGEGIDAPNLGGLGVDSVSGSGDEGTDDDSSRSAVYGIGIGAAWELDVWGRVRSKKAASKSDSAALEADYEFARQSLAATVARAYFSAIEAAQQEANAKETLSLYEEYSKLTGAREKQGFASNFDIAQIRSRTAGARDTYITAQAARSQAIRAIEVITSNYPAGKLAMRRTLPESPRVVPAGLPAQILERRPDLIASERRFAAAFHRTNEARTARLPRFAMSASSGLGTADLEDVGTIDSLSWSLGAAVFQPIFFGGELKAAQDIRTAEQKSAVASYVAHALRAFQDVEDALAADYYLKQREAALNDMVASSAEAAKLGGRQFDEGQVDMFTVLRLAGENLAGKIELTKVQASRLRERVNLHLALGGDFGGDGAAAK